jgi:hypothetical protein
MNGTETCERLAPAGAAGAGADRAHRRDPEPDRGGDHHISPLQQASPRPNGRQPGRLRMMWPLPSSQAGPTTGLWGSPGSNPSRLSLGSLYH